MKLLLRLLNLWGPPLLWMAVIFLFSSFPKRSLPDYGGYDFAVKKTAHVAVYALLGLLLFRALAASRSLSGRLIAQTLALAGFYALTDEFHQFFVAGRGSSPVDVLIDLVGICFGMAGWLLLIPRIQARTPRSRPTPPPG